MSLTESKATEVSIRFETYITNLVANVVSGNFPNMIMSSSSGNKADTVIDFSKKKSRRKFALLIHLMSKCYAKDKKKESSTVRDLYYENVNVFGNQPRLNLTVISLCNIFRLTRTELYLEATGKGLIAGDLKWTNLNGDVISISNFPCGMVIPSNVSGITNLESSAKYIVVVEKDAVFQRLLDENVFHHLGPIILVTGKGYPDMATRRLLNQLTEHLRIPTFALVDADPYGIEIALIVKRGSLQMNRRKTDSHQFLVPDLILLGLLPSEFDKLSLPNDSKIPLTEKDNRKLMLMADRLKFDKQWHDEIQLLCRNGVKVELEALSEISAQYLTTVYLKHKLYSYMECGSLYFNCDLELNP